jgi:hypothetical protein
MNESGAEAALRTGAESEGLGAVTSSRHPKVKIKPAANMGAHFMRELIQ